MKVLVADDEPLARELLVRLLAETGGVRQVVEATDGLTVLRSVAEQDPDILILDIMMPGMDGIEAAGLLRAREAGPMRPAIIFASAVSDRALEAFDVDAADYLLKPIRRDRLAEALERARRRLGPARAAPADTEGLWVRVRQGQVRVPLSQVSHISAARDHVFLHADGRTWMHRTTMARMEALGAAHGLVRIHRSAMVRLNRIVAVVQSAKSLKVRLDSGAELPVGPAYRKLFRSPGRAPA